MDDLGDVGFGVELGVDLGVNVDHLGSRGRGAFEGLCVADLDAL